MKVFFLKTLMWIEIGVLRVVDMQEKRKSSDFLLSNAYLKTSLSLAALPILSRK